MQRRDKVDTKETCNLDILANKIVNAAFVVHRELGPGLLEGVYETCFCHELSKLGLNIQRQLPVKINYDNMTFDAALRLDVLVEESVICELKSVEVLHPVFFAQLLSYLKLTNKKLGFLINFNVPLIKQGINRVIL
jgi:GxxExxY protein